jgi:hypothetical protein
MSIKLKFDTQEGRREKERDQILKDMTAAETKPTPELSLPWNFPVMCTFLHQQIFLLITTGSRYM